MANGDSFLPITLADLDAHMNWANALMKQVSWRSERQINRGERGLVISQVLGAEQISDTLSLIQLAREISGGSEILTADVNRVVETIRNGLTIGLNLSQQYVRRSGFDVMQQQNRGQNMSPAQQGEFNAKTTMASAVALFAASAYIVHELSTYQEGKVSALKLDYPGVPEVIFRNPQNALMCSVYHFARYCTQKAGVVNNGLEMVKLTLLHFEAIMNEVADKAGSFTYREPFTEVSYRLEESDFIVKGFKPIKRTAVVSTEFRKVDFSQIVGNRRAKHQAVRLAMMLCCYDAVRKLNPFLELGFFALVRMGFGVPGTGKSLQIAATATKIQELSDKLGIPFLFWPMPAAIVSTFQGGSAERMEDWMRRITDDDKIVYAPIDDAENNFMNRAREGVSAGVREVISVFLRNTEGASAIIRGNAVLEMFTNLPEIIDPAVLSRVQARFPIDGAQTFGDFVDQDYLWWRRFGKFDERFAAMDNASGYVYLSEQAALRNLAELEAKCGSYKIRDHRVQEAIDRARKKFSLTDHGFFAELFLLTKQAYPGFSSRDVRNIESAVDGRLLDFDLPHEWFDDPELFYRKSYETKVEMLKEAMRTNMRGLSFGEIRYEETVRYLDTLAEISNVDFERQVGDTTKRMQIQLEAQRRLQPAKT